MKVLRFARSMLLMVFVLGVAIVGGFFIRRGVDRRNQLKLMAEFEERLEKINEAHADNDTHYTGQTERNLPVYFEGDTIAVLSLERLGIKVAISEGTTKEKLRVSAGHFSDTDMPGEGNFAIAGHSSRIYTCLFNDLHKAVVGDELVVEAENGRHVYIISNMETVDPENVHTIEHQNESIITIVTCINDGAQRLIIRGIEEL